MGVLDAQSHWCVRCGLVKKLRVIKVVDAVPQGRCACKGALAGNECFGALWETKWSVELTKMVEALAPASWNKTLRALRRIISAEESWMGAPDSNKEWAAANVC